MHEQKQRPVAQIRLAIDSAASEPVVIPPEETEHGILFHPSGIPSFVQKELTEEVSDRINVGTAGEPDMHSCTIRTYYGIFRDKEEDSQLYCPKCGRQLAGNGTVSSTLFHLPEGSAYTRLEVIRHRYRCTNKECRYSYVYPISFQASGHMVTQLLFDYVKQLLSYGLSYRQIASITGLNKNTISAINSQAV